MEVLVFIRTRAGKALDVVEEVKKTEGVKEAFAITGRYDVVARVEAESIEKLGETVVRKIHGIDGVERTETAIIVA
jgi:DNA-binding Lrp family transcriptional regulator